MDWIPSAERIGLEGWRLEELVRKVGGWRNWLGRLEVAGIG